jgi:hypothetical protein
LKEFVVVKSGRGISVALVAPLVGVKVKAKAQALSKLFLTYVNNFLERENPWT